MPSIKDSAAFIYVIGYGNMMKVGISRNPLNRLSQLQTAVPEDLAIYFLCAMPSRKMVERVEASIHKKLAHRHARGEWFRIDAADAVKAADATVRRYARGRRKAQPDRVFRNSEEMCAALGIPL